MGRRILSDEERTARRRESIHRYGVSAKAKACQRRYLASSKARETRSRRRYKAKAARSAEYAEYVARSVEEEDAPPRTWEIPIAEGIVRLDLDEEQ